MKLNLDDESLFKYNFDINSNYNSLCFSEELGINFFCSEKNPINPLSIIYGDNIFPLIFSEVFSTFYVIKKNLRK